MTTRPRPPTQIIINFYSLLLPLPIYMLPSLLSSLLSWGYSSSTSYSYSYSKKPSSYADSEFWTYVLTQLLPLLVLLGLPALVFLARAYWNKKSIGIGRIVIMVLETLFGVSLPLPWGWGTGGNGHGKENDGKRDEDRRTRRRDRVRSGSKTSRSGANVNAGTCLSRLVCLCWCCLLVASIVGQRV